MSITPLPNSLQAKLAISPGGFNVAASALNNIAQIPNILTSKDKPSVKAQAISEQIGLTLADFYTAGLASKVFNLFDTYLPGVTKAWRKINSALSGFPILDKLFGSKNTWKTEGNKLEKLIQNGINIPAQLQSALQLTRGRSKEELIDLTVPLDFVGFKQDGTWTNNRFAMSRKENDLTAYDIWGYSAFFEKFGNDWLGTFSEEQRFKIANKALELGLIKEHHGTIDIKWTRELENFAKTV